MTPNNLLAKRHRAATARPPVGRFGLEPAQWFHYSLKRERARADHTGRELALVLFTPRQRRHPEKTQARIARVLRQQLQATDEPGWFDDERIGVIMPEASVERASRLADEVCLTFSTRTMPPLCEVFTYPSNWLSNDHGNDGPAEDDTRQRKLRRLERLFVKPLPVWKRALDLLGASVGLFLSAPLWLLLAILIKLESRGPVFFRQRRTGLGGKAFVIYKFRTMSADAETQKASLLAFNEQDGPAFKIKSDPRVTRLGRFLRATSIDELPQLINVLKGEMSLVGPRPLPCSESDACLPWQRRRLDVTPGLTCIWQVRGRSRVTFDEWMRMDLAYVDSVSLRHDLKLLLATVWAVVHRAGAY
ncbi:MAG TPA: sugar transferase [Pirellulales bacterium]|nr:sugar transferase [Pirellulales bacterium]